MPSRKSGTAGSNSPMPAWISPMLATLVGKPFYDDGWIFEAKLDGIRCLAFRDGKNLELYSRNQKRLNGGYPELVKPLLAQPAKSFIVDGEIVAFRNGVTSFSQLQGRMQLRDALSAGRTGIEIFYYVFDLLYLNGHDLRGIPLIERKKLLELFEFQDPLRYSDHYEADGQALYEQACKNGLEGIIAKRSASPYVSKRSRDWLKVKCWAEQEFVIGGYTDPRGERVGLGALLLGYYDGGRFRYAGKVGTGFDESMLGSLYKKLHELETESSPFDDQKRALKGFHWVKPKLIAQIRFTEWTGDGKLRHPAFQGLRSDKKANEVVRERPA